MLHTVTFRSLAIALCGWLPACDAGALTLGPARGAVLVGRPLEVSVPVTLDQPVAETPCPAGEVRYGQSRVEQGVTLRWQPGTGNQGVVHVTSTTPIGEPTVSVDLSVGCTQPTTRHYVLLAEVPARNEALVTPSSAAIVQPAAAAAAPTSARPRVAQPERVQPDPPPPTEPRLQLQPVDLAGDGAAILRLTSELATLPGTDPQRRAAAAALWAALQKSPEEALQDQQRLQALQGELQAMRETTRQNAQAAAQMRMQVDQARTQRAGAAWLVGVLTAAFAALLAWILWRGWRAARVDHVNRWFDAHGESTRDPMADEASGPSAPAHSFLPSVPDTTPGADLPPAPAAPRTGRGRPSARSAAHAAASPEEFPLSRGALRMVGVEEVVDIQDKVDFFVSLGQVDQAIALLEAHVHDQVETSALPWIHLLELYHREGRRSDYERLRAGFRERFTAQVPDFDHFHHPGASLENYSRALSRIVALWPSRRVLDVIEESIFRKPGLPGAEPFSLEAYRELVLLYHIAKDVAPAPQAGASDDAPPAPVRDASVQPLNLLHRPEPDPAEREQLLVPPSSVRVGVDIDLGDLAEPGQRPDARDLPAADFDISGFDPAEPGEPQRPSRA